MFVIKRNQIIVTALVVMVAVAGYLNYQEGKLAETAKNMVQVDDSDLIGSILPDDDPDFVDGELGIAIDDLGEMNFDQAYDDDMEVVAQQEKSLDATNKKEPGQAIFVNSNGDDSYFLQAKLDREQARSKRKDLLMEILDNKNVEKDKKSECADEILELQKRIEKETSAEAMIEAKGFTEAYVRIDDETVDVVVGKEALSEAEIAQIEDIVKRKTGFGADKIRISPLKK